MDNILKEHIGVRCLVYMDDIIIFSTSLQEHLINLKLILETLRKYNMEIQIDKCEFFQKEVAFLGHVVTPEGVKPNPEKIEAIQEWPLPANEKELRACLGVIGYYRKFIKDFARIAKLLTQQLHKGETVCHTTGFVSAFQRCKGILTSSHVLQSPTSHTFYTYYRRFEFCLRRGIVPGSYWIIQTNRLRVSHTKPN